MLREIRMRNILSFGESSKPIDLRPLNVIIGPNGSGKSNLLEGFGLLKNAPFLVNKDIRKDGIKQWLWKGSDNTPVAEIEIVWEPNAGSKLQSPLRYRICFTESRYRFEIVDELIENAEAYSGHKKPYFYYRYEDNHPVINIMSKGYPDGRKRKLQREDIDPEKSILAQRKDPDQFPEITLLGEYLQNFGMYRHWTFGSHSPIRDAQRMDLQSKWLEENAANLALVLNRLKSNFSLKSQIQTMLHSIYEQAMDFDTRIIEGTVQVVILEMNKTIPASRLSDGTLRYLCLLTILLDPTPPPLICIDEPELGLHPDMISSVAEALRIASERTQIIVTTHSPQLVDEFTDTPEVVMVCENGENGTIIERLNPEELSHWLEDYSLGNLWMTGGIGGTRW